MARLGAIEEEEEQVPSQADRTELSLEREEDIGVEEYVAGLSLAESVNCMADVMSSKSENEVLRDLAEKTVEGMSLAETEINIPVEPTLEE